MNENSDTELVVDVISQMLKIQLIMAGANETDGLIIIPPNRSQFGYIIGFIDCGCRHQRGWDKVQTFNGINGVLTNLYGANRAQTLVDQLSEFDQSDAAHMEMGAHEFNQFSENEGSFSPLGLLTLADS